jgi:hypothetical protein
MTAELTIGLTVATTSSVLLALLILWRQWRANVTLNTRLDAVLKDRDATRAIAEAAVTALDGLRTRLRVKSGEADFPYMPRVPPIRHSDPTRIAEDRADVLTLEQRLKTTLADIERLTGVL